MTETTPSLFQCSLSDFFFQLTENTSLRLTDIGLVVVLGLLVLLLILNQRKKRIITDTSQELAETEARYALLFEHSPIPLLEEDLSAVKNFLDRLIQEGVSDFNSYFDQHPESLTRCIDMVRVSAANRAALSLYGAQHCDELIHLSTILPEEQNPVFKQAVLHLMSEGTTQLVFENKALDGRLLTVERRVVVANGYEKNWKKVFVTVIDITEQVKLKNENKEFEKQLQQTQKLEAIGSLAGGIAHDFNNILAPIMGRAELMLVEKGDESDIAAHCRGIIEAARRARDLVKQILTFSRQVDQEIKPVSIAEVVEEVVKLVRPTLPATIEIATDLPAKSPKVMADSTQLHQVLMNLVTNAYHAMEDQGGHLSLRLETITLGLGAFDDLSITPGLYQKLTITDTGHGMDEATMAKIFDPYFTTKARGKGTGLGLAVVLGILRGYGGEIRVSSAPGKGTSFTLYFPVVEMADASPQLAIDPQEPMPRGSEHILLVDDEKSIADVTTSMLERLGYRVTVRLSGFDALEAYRSLAHTIDLVIADLTMPQMTGLQLYKEIKLIQPAVKVIICTGFSEELTSDKSRVIGIEAFLNKPVVMADLAHCVRRVLDS